MNAITDHLHTSRYISEIDRFAAELGLRLELCRDFREFREIRNSMNDRSPMSPIFDPAVTDVGPGNGFWIKGTDHEGKIMHLQATRRSDLVDVNLADHLYELRRLYRLPGLNMETDVQRDSYSAPAPAADFRQCLLPRRNLARRVAPWQGAVGGPAPAVAGVGPGEVGTGLRFRVRAHQTCLPRSPGSVRLHARGARWNPGSEPDGECPDQQMVGLAQPSRI